MTDLFFFFFAVLFIKFGRIKLTIHTIISLSSESIKQTREKENSSGKKLNEMLNETFCKKLKAVNYVCKTRHLIYLAMF